METITLRPHQVEGARKGYDILKEHGLVYNRSLERVGKSLMAIGTVELTTRDKCLIVTRKAAIGKYKSSGGFKWVYINQDPTK